MAMAVRVTSVVVLGKTVAPILLAGSLTGFGETSCHFGKDHMAGNEGGLQATASCELKRRKGIPSLSNLQGESPTLGDTVTALSQRA